MALAAPFRPLGIWLVVATFVLSQFVEVTFFSVGEFVVSLQKALAMSLLPLAFVLIGYIRKSAPLLVFAAALSLSYSLAYAADGDFGDPRLLTANVTAATGFVGATLLYTALTDSNRAWRTLAHS